MSRRLLVLKFGGESLASPELIAAAARRVAEVGSERPVAVVVSARRGVTDHLLGLVTEVGEATWAEDAPPADLSSAADRALASGEIVSASLLALALTRLGVLAEPLDAREAGLHSDGAHSRARLAIIRPQRIARLLGAGVVPVVAGFQGWHRGRLTTLGRGGSDITAVELAVALGASACEFIKDARGIETADPRQVPGARTIPLASHQFLRELARSGSRVIHPAAALAAERQGLPLAFTPLKSGEPATRIIAGPLRGVAACALQRRRGVLHVELPSTADRAALGGLQGKLRDIDPGSEITLIRDELGWKVQLVLDVRECQSAARLVRRALPEAQVLPPCEGLATVSLVGIDPTPEITRRLSQTTTACGARVTRSGHTGQRIWFVVPDESAIQFQAELHAEFIERGVAVAPLEVLA